VQAFKNASVISEGGLHVNGLQQHLIGMSGVDIYAKLKDDILTLKLKPGQMISENEVANIYNVSRTPVKNAFLRLKGEKYIEIIPQKGSYVTLLDMKSIKDIIYMRSVLETDALNSILDMGIASTVLAGLSEILNRQRALIKSGMLTSTSFYEVDNEFHHRLFTYTGRERLWDVIQDCQVYYARFRLLDTMTTSRYEDLIVEHERIASALEEQDREALKISVFDHLHGNIRVLSQKIESEFREYFVQPPY